MKKTILLALILPAMIFAQYWGERTTEQSFEQSNLYFKNHFLNTFGVKYFKDIAVGMLDDHFLNLEINPAIIPDLGDKELYMYLDFRGDRTEPEIIEQYVMPYYDLAASYVAPIDRRWFSETRDEPEPLVSLGILTYPIETLGNKFYIGGTYQLILKEESYYDVPYGIYNSQYYYDSFGNAIRSNYEYDVITRYSGTDEMVNEGHLYSAFAGYKINEKINIGLSINGVSHSRKGSYSNSYNDGYYVTQNQWNNSDYTQRNQEYSHFDINTGVIYKLSPKLTSGLKLGILSGGVNQDFVSKYSYYNTYNQPETSYEWSTNFSNSATDQYWNHDGNTYYFRVFFNRKLAKGSEASIFYRYGYSDIEATTKSTINDTSYYASSWSGENYISRSSVSDIRNGEGSRNKYSHEAMLNFKWKLSEKNVLLTGIYFNSNKTKIHSSEPVIANRYSNYTEGSLSSLYENKELVWDHEALDWSLQIPIIFKFEASEYLSVLLGINRIFESWDMTDITTAYFHERKSIENGIEKVDKNFGERYFQPDRGITEDHTDLIAQLEANLSSSLKISLLLDPEFEDEFRIAQWWLSFRAGL
jgi:hypothetical protein